MKNTSNYHGVTFRNNTTCAQRVRLTSASVAPSITSTPKVPNNKLCTNVSSQRKPTPSVKITKSLSRSQDSLTFPSTTPKAKLNTAVRNRPQSALGLQNPKFDKRPSKLSTTTMNNNAGIIRKASSKDNVDSAANKDREKENVMKVANKKTTSAVVILEKEKKGLELQICELLKNADSKKAEISALKTEINKMKNEANIDELAEIKLENKVLKERLAEAAAKQTLGKHMQPSVQSLPDVIDCQTCTLPCLGLLCNDHHPKTSVSTEFESIDHLPDVGAGCSYNAADRNDWDKQSNSSVSEMSVACLQDRIMQMEENHYSTNEELQATLQELSDLQDQLTDLQIDNEQMRDEKAVMLESLCSQTEKLEECRSQICSLKQLLFDQGPDGGVTNPLNQCERQQKLVELLKSAEMERETFTTKCNDLLNKVQCFEHKAIESDMSLAILQDRIKLLESTIDSANADKKELEKQLSDLKEQVDNDQIEITRVNSLLENERQKVDDVQKARDAESKGELDRLVDEARKEKEQVDMKATALQEQLAICQCEVLRLKEHISILQDQAMVNKNNAKKSLSDMQYKLEQMNIEKEQSLQASRCLQDTVHELEMTCQHHLQDKRDLKATISDLQNKCVQTVDKMNEAVQQYEAVQLKLCSDTEEWHQFQNDLLITVRVANDFKMEAQIEMDRLKDLNDCLKKKNSSLKCQLDKLKTTSAPSHPAPGLLSNVEQDLAHRRQTLNGKRNGANQLSVRGLIESIENATKQAKAQGPYSRSSSSSSLSSCTSDTKLSPSQPALRAAESDAYIKAASEIYIKDAKTAAAAGTTTVSAALKSEGFGESNGCPGRPTKDTGQTSGPIDPKPVVSILASKLDPMRRNSYTDVGDKKDPLATLAKNGGSKRNALLKWCQNKLVGYKGVDVTNFSSSWNDGLAFSALLHSYLPDKIPYNQLDSRNKKKNFSVAFEAAQSVGIQSTLNINDMISMERPDWQSIMGYVTLIYKHFET